jgi:hypothetical protein
MAMTIEGFNSSRYALFGKQITTSLAVPFLDYVTNSYYSDEGMHDTFYLSLRGLVVDGLFPIDHALGYASQRPNRSSCVYLGDAPVNFPYSFAEDVTEFFSFWDALRLLKGERLRDGTSRKGENGVIHHSYTGSGIAVPADFALLRAESGTRGTYGGGATYPGFTSGYRPHRRLHLDQSGAVTGTSTNFPVDVFGRVSSLIRAIQPLASNGRVWTSRFKTGKGRWAYLDLADFSAFYTDRAELVIKYSIKMSLYWPGYDYPSQYFNVVSEDVTLRFRPAFTPIVGTPSAGWHYVTGYLFYLDRTAKRHPRSVEGRNNWPDTAYDVEKTYTHSLHPQNYGVILSTVVGSSPLPTTIRHRDGTCFLVRRRAHIENIRHELRKATFYSVQDALWKHLEVISTNHVETMSELRSVAGLIKPVDVAKLVRFVRDARRFRLLSAGRSLADLATSFHLWQSFAAGPTGSAVEELVEKFDDIRTQLRASSSLGRVTLYGKFTFNLPNEYHKDVGRVVVYRSKVDVEFPDAAWFVFALYGKAVGLAPFPSSLWDCVPFSFVLDWFTNIGTRMEDIDSRIFFTAVQLNHIVNSMTIYHDLADAELQGYTINPSLHSPPQGKYYERFITQIFPPLRSSSTFDFRPPQGIPSVKTAGALAWQVLT